MKEKLVIVENSSDKLHGDFGISDERIDELFEKTREAFSDETELAKVLEKINGFCENLGEYSLCVLNLGSNLQRLGMAG